MAVSEKEKAMKAPGAVPAPVRTPVEIALQTLARRNAERPFSLADSLPGARKRLREAVQERNMERTIAVIFEIKETVYYLGGFQNQTANEALDAIIEEIALTSEGKKFADSALSELKFRTSVCLDKFPSA